MKTKDKYREMRTEEKKGQGGGGREGEVQEFPVSSATVELAAQALSVQPAQIAKTLAFEDGDSCILVVAAGDAKTDNRKFKDTFGKKGKMLAFDQVEPKTGHPVGGVCPFCNPAGVKVYLDRSLQRFEPEFGHPANLWGAV